ncbi:nucleoside-diphosphate kinase [Deinococcus soli (ex Cha et al. 2016)]|uniref:nucleoside-diphosphate kinase n=1 Tax=Deinococcus soli (ex Cha et al. 2016) TaxID=1309411 RepID=UPI00166720C0|nr:nucleoside-diphosphate kinase [Deinococcus soli (ex Cha et al. 2016)]GGB60606.1 hypothetical protein GCM10008019_15680 [Deinococcus soli (ex Cha et al. 2016)]
MTLLSPAEQHLLTRVPWKKSEFFKDPYFREAFLTVQQAFADAALDHLQELTLVVFRPDALLLGKAHDIYKQILQRGYVPLAARTVRLNRNCIREIWRYSYYVASADRITLHERIFDLTEAVVVLFRGVSHPQPATVRLSLNKGSAKQEKQGGNAIRRTVGSPNRFLSLFHVSDEPIDVVRELGVLFNWQDRLAFLHGAQQNWDGTGAQRSTEAQLLAQQERCAPVGTPGFEAALSRRHLTLPAHFPALAFTDDLLHHQVPEPAHRWASVALASFLINPYDSQFQDTQYEKFDRYWKDPTGATP